MVEKWHEETLPQEFTFPFAYRADVLCKEAAERVKEYLRGREEWAYELSEGKMIGVMVVENANGERGYIASFSGTLGGKLTHEWFVSPVYDYEEMGGIFKNEESAIGEINRQIEGLMASEEYAVAQKELEETERMAESKIAKARARYSAHRAERKRLREGELTEAKRDRMERESQFEKAEIKRTKRIWADRIDEQKKKVSNIASEIDSLREERKHRSERLQRWLFGKMKLLRADGTSRTVWDIFLNEHRSMPPSGTGDCAAPRLLQYAYGHELRPISMAEFWVGKSPKDSIRHDGQFYPACQSKCGPVLRYMTTGLSLMPNPLVAENSDEIEVVYEDKWILIVCKPSGLMTVSDNVENDSLMKRVRKHREIDGSGYVHRLDMSTSGLVIVAKDRQSHAIWRMMFEKREVSKRYVAIVEGEPKEKKGVICLPISADEENKPLRKVDYENGQEATTRYECTGTSNGRSRLRLYPITGRTHQLRVHTAHSDGLGCPIVGDNLYGTLDSRLMLHAEMIEFTHPMTGRHVRVERLADF